MKEQNFKNHGRWVPTFHILTFLLMLSAFIISIIIFIYPTKKDYLIPILMILFSIVVISIAFHSRLFALKAQDRAIRAEENLRYFILTGKRLDKRITLKQLIGLRFAEDDEFVELVDRALKENLSQKEIKIAIKNWRPDHYRV